MEENKYITTIKKYLVEKYGSVKEEWELSISMLVDTLETYAECKKVLKEVGIYNYERNKKNPLLGTLKECQITMLKIVKELGISPYAASKIKSMVEDDTDDFIDKLVN
ncbi:MAG: P27 family phage terminase small subunit [Muribaculaceae bacterium]|nr:P27 family phage terminase small subunit [Muribaculaceae bacterium]